MTPVIPPTVGRKVWFRPTQADVMGDMARNGGYAGRMSAFGRDPLDATVVGVIDDRCVNLAIFDAEGNPHRRLAVRLVQPFDARAINGGGYCEWMPHQISGGK